MRRCSSFISTSLLVTAISSAVSSSSSSVARRAFHSGPPSNGLPQTGGSISPGDFQKLREQQQEQMQQQQNVTGGSMMPPPTNVQVDDEIDFKQEQSQQPPEPPKKPQEQKLLAVDENFEGTGVALLKLKNKPVNTLSHELLKELNEWMLWLGAADGVKGVVLSSDMPRVFCAGLDLKEFIDATKESFKSYWMTFQETYLILHTFPRPLVAAVTGSAPAGGCILSLCCDHRIMAKHPAGKEDKLYRIGLNETKFGFIACPWVQQTLSYIVGQRKAEKLLLHGETPTAMEAQKLGLVDEVCDDESEVISKAIKEVVAASKVSPEARWMTKDMMRRPLVQMFASQEDREYDAEFFASFAVSENVQSSMKDYVAKLGGGKKK